MSGDERRIEFEWDVIKAAANLRKHECPSNLRVPFFNDARVLTVADLEHSEMEDRWFSVGCASNGKLLSAAYLWTELDPATIGIRLISARAATPNEIRNYLENL